MTTQPSTNIWSDDEHALYLRLRMKTFWNMDYFEKVVLPLLDLPKDGQILDVGCGNGGISPLLLEVRPDLIISGIDFERKPIEDAASFAERNDWRNLRYAQADAHRLCFADRTFDGVVCQTVLTHVRNVQSVVEEMARVLKPGGVFFATEYTDSGSESDFDNVQFPKRDDTWYGEYFRLCRLYAKGKQRLGRGDETVGVRVPHIATQAGLDVYDVRLNDRAMHVFPPYRHEKQRNYLELIRTENRPVQDDRWLQRTIETITAGGGSEQDGRWFYAAVDSEGILEAIEEGNFAATGSYMLFLTFARKP